MKTERTDHLGRIVSVEVYAVGHLRNFQDLLAARHAPRGRLCKQHASRWWIARKRLKMLLGDLLIKRRNYWNGYLAEPVDSEFTPGKCGHGWTKERALRKLEHYWATQRWARHRCGLVRRICGRPGLEMFCLECSVSDGDWTDQ